jgi:hypothetical protein
LKIIGAAISVKTRCPTSLGIYDQLPQKKQILDREIFLASL